MTLGRRDTALACLSVALAAGWAASTYFLLRRRRRDDGDGLPLAFATCETLRVRSDAGRPYKLLVSLPLTYHADPPSAKYPVVYALDGEPYLFPLLVTAARTNHFFRRSSWYPDAIVVGVTADVEPACRAPRGALDVRRVWDALRPTRARDYLPTAAESPWGAPGAAPLLHVSGHADEFCAFLARRVVPRVEARYRADARARALCGKSFGGSGVAHAWIEPNSAATFTHLIASSPSLAWDGGAWFRLEAERRAGAPPAAARRVLVCAGARESDGLLAAVAEFKRALEEGGRGAPDLRVDVEIFERETHGSMSYPFACRALDGLAADLEERGLCNIGIGPS